MEQAPAPSIPLAYHFREEETSQARGATPVFLLPFALLLRPDRFFRSWGIHANVAWVILAAWVLGSAASINSILDRLRFGPDFFGFRIDSWATVWLIVIGLGILRGVIFSYGLGGLWTWLRLRICGVRGNEWNRSTRIYCFSNLIERSASLLALVYFSIRYESVSDFLAQPVGLVNLIAALAMLSSPLIAFFGVRACYKLRTVWSIMLFLLLPMLWRVAFLGMLFVNVTFPGTFSGSVPFPETAYAVEASTGMLRFEYPDGWRVHETDPKESSLVEATIDSDQGAGSLLIRVQAREEVDLIQYDLYLLSEQGYTIVQSAPAPNVRISQHIGDGVDYTISLSGKQYQMFHLLVPFDVDHDVLFRMIAPQSQWWQMMEGWKQVLDSLEIGDLYRISPDIEHTQAIERELYRFQAPGNWYPVEGRSFEHFEVSAKQYSWIVFQVMDRDLSAEDEFSMYIEHGIDDQLVSQSPMNSWLGFKGIGSHGMLRESLAGDQRFRSLFVPLADGRVLAIKKYQAISSSDLTDPGFELIESTFELLVEPAPSEPTADP